MIPAIVAAVIGVTFACGVIPALLFVDNLRRFKPPTTARTSTPSDIAVLIPARNEEHNIAACLDSVLSSLDITLQVLVLDDASTDRTAALVRHAAAHDPRVRLIQTQALPARWNGKQHACWLLANETSSRLLLFLDADVRLTPTTLARCAAQMQHSQLALLSGFPRQITIGWLEKLLLPLIHFVLLSFLPMGRARRSTNPAFAAGCGQFFLAERDAYFASGSHSAIRETRHDGLRLPRLFRQHRFRTDIFDLTSLAEVRMYDSPRAVWTGLSKNATEGIATPTRIVPFTLLLLIGQVIPTLFFAAVLLVCAANLIVGATFDQPTRVAVVSVAVTLAFIASYLPRLLAARRFRQPWLSAALHPLGVLLLLCIQWYAFLRQLAGRPVSWRSRAYSSATGEEVDDRPNP